MNRKDIENWLGLNELNRTVKSADVFDNINCVSLLVEYFKDLDTVLVQGAQVAELFNSVITKGRFYTDATDDIGLPEFPEFLINS